MHQNYIGIICWTVRISLSCSSETNSLAKIESTVQYGYCHFVIIDLTSYMKNTPQPPLRKKNRLHIGRQKQKNCKLLSVLIKQDYFVQYTSCCRILCVFQCYNAFRGMESDKKKKLVNFVSPKVRSQNLFMHIDYVQRNIRSKSLARE